MADDLLLHILELLAAGIGGTILGAILSPLVAQRLQDRSEIRRRLRQTALDPVYDYADKLKSQDTRFNIEPLPGITPSDRDRMKKKERSAIEGLAKAVSDFQQSQRAWTDHEMALFTTDLRERFDDALKPRYLNEDNK